MATANQFIAKAFVVMGIKNPLAEQIQTALDVLNDMMSGFINRRWQYAHSELSIGDNIQLPERYHEALKYLFCEALIPVFGAAIDTSRTQIILKNAKDARDVLSANLGLPIGIKYPVAFSATTINQGTNNGFING